MSYAADHLIPLVDEGLGNSAYLVDLGDGRGLAVDASRDLRALHRAASRPGLKVAFAADTHLHADFLTGAVQLAADDGATVLASATGHRSFPHTALAGGDEVDLGGLTLASLGSYPAYFSQLAEANRQGPAPLTSAPGLGPLTPAAVRSVLGRGGLVIDVRPMADFAAGHIPGAVSIPLRGQFATWLGWLVPDGVPLAFVLGDGQDPAEVAWQALKIGYEQLAGQLADGMAAWVADRGPTEQVELVTAGRIDGRAVLDVRQAAEAVATGRPLQEGQ